MPLLDALREKLNTALLPLSSSDLTRRDALLPTVAGKAHAVIGMRRSGKTCFLKQPLAARRRSGASVGLLGSHALPRDP